MVQSNTISAFHHDGTKTKTSATHAESIRIITMLIDAFEAIKKLRICMWAVTTRGCVGVCSTFSSLCMFELFTRADVNTLFVTLCRPRCATKQRCDSVACAIAAGVVRSLRPPWSQESLEHDRLDFKTLLELEKRGDVDRKLIALGVKEHSLGGALQQLGSVSPKFAVLRRTFHACYMRSTCV
jgi:hypothetical protein